MDATQSGVIPIAYEYETPIIASNAREKFMVQNADCVLAITDADKNNFINTYDLDRDKVRVFPVGVNHGNYETGIEGSLDSPFVIQSLNAEELFDIKTMQYAEEEGSYKGWSIEAIQEHKMGVEPKIAIFNQYLEEFSSAMDDENYEKAKTLYKELKEMVSPGSHESKILKLDMEMIEADDKA